MQLSNNSSFRFHFWFFVFGLLLVSSCGPNNDEVKINPPTADFAVKPDAVNTQVIRFINNSTSYKSFIWNFGDGDISATSRSPIHAYDAPGTYSVSLTTVGWNDEEVSTTKEIVVTAPTIMNRLDNNGFANTDSWTVTMAYKEAESEDLVATFNNGLTLTVPEGDIEYVMIHQAVTLEAGIYQLDLDLDLDSASYSSEISLYLSKTIPEYLTDPHDSTKVIAYELDGVGCANTAYSASLLASETCIFAGQEGGLADGKVVISAADAGLYYFIIYSGTYGGALGANFNINSAGLYKVN